MASHQSSSLALLVLTLTALLISPAQSLTCTSQTFTNNARYTNCVDLTQLTAYLHWTHDQSNSSLSIAFIAPPAKSDGWVAWAINPTETGMKGSQTLLAFQSNGAMTVKTYNISAIGPIAESKLSFEVWDLRAEQSDGVMRIFAKLKVPRNGMTVNQVWQVGASVTSGVPDAHPMQTANLNSKSTLNLSGGQTVTPSGGDSRTKKKNVGFSISFCYFLSFLVSAILVIVELRFWISKSWFFTHLKNFFYFFYSFIFTTGGILAFAPSGHRPKLPFHTGRVKFGLSSVAWP
jgi:hypothetical protein